MLIRLALPLEVRLAGLFVVGTCIGSLINLGVYRMAWNQRPISPWSRPDPAAPPRCVWDRIPVFGWLGLRREASLLGAGFWIRPLVVELLAGVGLAALYWWEVEEQALCFPVNGFRGVAVAPTMLHAQFLAHAVLIALMLLASLIDADEKIIPDGVTVPGTLFGLLMAIVFPLSALPYPAIRGARIALESVRLSSPSDWPPQLNGHQGLAIGLACWALWCVAILPRVWYGRHGWRRAFAICTARLVRSAATWWIAGLGVVGAVAIAGVWWQWGQSPRWAALLSALAGMAASGGLVWLVRRIGTITLRREAMGFGDVTLMAMIGAVLGWQAGLLIFFLAPFAGIVIGVSLLIVRREHEIAYGPFLCLAALCTILWWPDLWQRGNALFALGWYVPVVLAIVLVLLAGMLAVWQVIKKGLGIGG